ncbi:MAG: hypothetical protein BZY79_02610 [SAR202 cluster bacterium Casp-Chloro-G4]|nr:molybdopterin-dependent oxidoreductase [Chloroflexota bacterium]MDA1227971.1 molybdopterin-dependent oxidoreductase [Chloroflexota bacterium]PKB61719.1 MAG: hypothetical protein BZY79_02610 [SAR202 cluster bacterium Casp-Chloro-G4]
MAYNVVGKSVPRYDLPEKLTGESKYAGDIKLPGMLHAKVLRSPHPHARILSIDASAAEALTGVHAVLTPFNTPTGRVAPDLAILDTTVRFVGDEVAAVAADSEDAAQEALASIKVEYEVLPFVTDPREAIKSYATAIHSGGNLIGGEPLILSRGNIEEGFAEADLVVEESFTTPAHAGAALEPRVAVASWDGDRLTVWKSSRGVHADKLSLASALQIGQENVHVIGPTMGAGYGNKDETRLAAIVSALAKSAGRPVRLELTREEEFVAGRKRHSTETTVKVGVKNDGTVTAIHTITLMDTGAYLSSGPGVVRRAGQGALYLYRCANVQYDGYLTYTNQPSGGSYRALGAPQGHFALESTMEKVAEALGMDSLEFRLKNHVGPEGQPGERITPADQIIDTQPVEGGVPFSSNGLQQCLELGSEAIDWQGRHERNANQSGSRLRGVGMGMFIYRGGPGTPTNAWMTLNADGTLQVTAGTMDVGEGNSTAIPQMVAEELGVAYEDVKVLFGDSDITPEAPITSGSTATFSTGQAALNATKELKSKILAAASESMGMPANNLEIANGVVKAKDGIASMTLAEVAAITGQIRTEASLTPGSTDFIVNSFGAHFAEVEVDTVTGNVDVLHYVAAHDSGNVINPQLATNQVEGGVSQMLGFALTEQMLTDPGSGVTLNGSFLEHKGATIQEFPNIDVIFADVYDPVGPFGMKALGEPPNIGVAPAIINAIYDAIGVRIHDLPATPDKILDALDRKEREGRA